MEYDSIPTLLLGPGGRGLLLFPGFCLLVSRQPWGTFLFPQAGQEGTSLMSKVFSPIMPGRFYDLDPVRVSLGQGSKKTP